MKKFILPLVLALGMTVPVVAAQANSDHVTICHRTGSASNPYVQISPSASGVFHGHLDHEQTGNGLGGDIIPPFQYQGQTYSKNWDAQGQAIWNNGCRVPGPTPSPSPSPTPTPTPPPGPTLVTVPFRIGLRMAPDAPFTEKGSFQAEKGSGLKVVIERCDTSLGYVATNDGTVVSSHTFVTKPSRSTLRVTIGSIDVKEVARNRGKDCAYRTYIDTV